MKKILLTIVITVLCFNTYAKKTVGPDDVLSVRNGIYYLEGKPFAELSFNKFDLFWTLWEAAYAGSQLDDKDPAVKKQDEALSELADNGFRTIRFFGFVHGNRYNRFREVYMDPQRREHVYYLALDKAVELLEKHGLKAVFSLGCDVFVDRESGENVRELVADPNSVSRRWLNGYLDEVIARYKNSPAVLMWEVTNELTLKGDIQPGTLINEGQRMPTSQQIALFYEDVVKYIGRIDPLRMVTSGGSILRNHAYGLSHGTGWKIRDTYDQQREMYALMYKDTGLGTVDVHYYLSPKGTKWIRDNEGNPMHMELTDLKKIAESISRPLYVGEYGSLPKARTNKEYWPDENAWFLTFSDDNPDAIKWVTVAADRAVESGVWLIHWWCYQSDRPQDQKNPQRMDLDLQRTPELFKIIVEANQRIKEKFALFCASENIH